MAIRTFNLDTPRGFFGVRAYGLASAPPLILLHGFPDDASSFDHVLPKLAAMGCYAVSPYLRGYAPSTLMPPFDIGTVADDLCAICAAISPGKPVDFIGHDWGALAFYWAAARAPHQFRKAVAMSVPHPKALAANRKWSVLQLWRSRYIGLFQGRDVSNSKVMADNLAYVDKLWHRWSPGLSVTPPAHLPQHIGRVKQTFHDSMPAPLEMYRQSDITGLDDPVSVPTLYLHGADDRCIGASMAGGQDRYFVNDYRAEVLPGVGHFLHHEQPDRFVEVVGKWLAEEV